MVLEWEEAGDAIRYLDCSGGIGWKAKPKSLGLLRDAELDAIVEYKAF